MWPMKTSHALLWQGVLLAGALGITGWFGLNAAEHLARRGMQLDFGFLRQVAGFDVPFSLIPFKPTDTYLRVLGVVLLNTLLVSALGIVTATILGLGLGIMRLSANWLVRNTARAVVELVRNTPQLLQIVFWYVGVLQTLPQARQSLGLPGGAFLNIRGLFLPKPVMAPWGDMVFLLCLAALLAAPFAARLRWRGQRIGAWAWLLPAVAFLVFGFAIEGWDRPQLLGFNFKGGTFVPPELVALWAGLSLYSAVFIAEIVRGSIAGVSHGQTEAAQSLGLRSWPTLRLIVLPQALRIMIPQVTSQYLNLIKSSSLGAAIAYPEIVQIFAGTVLNQSGRAIEVMVIVMAVFLIINLLASAALGRANASAAIRER